VLVAQLWHQIMWQLARLRWPLASLVAAVVVLASILVVPSWLVHWELGPAARTLTASDMAKAINDVRATLLQGIGGAVLLLGAYITYRQLQVSREGQVTERFTHAIDQLGHEALDVRLGGIYALERISNDSPDDRTTITEVLTAFIRGHAPWPPRLPGQFAESAPIEQVPDLQVRAPDVHAALTVLARRQLSPRPAGRLDLHATDLRKARLDGAKFQEATLFGAQLQKARLTNAQLQGAILSHAQLQGARLRDAKLEGASLDLAQIEGALLDGAQLQKAFLNGAQLRGAFLGGTQLQGATLRNARLRAAHLHATNFEGADLTGADLQAASLKGVNFRGAMLDRVLFDNTYAHSTVTWPTDFDPRQVSGIIMIPAQAEQWRPVLPQDEPISENPTIYPSPPDRQ
jgi:uncharacterized protein YjbI with pentapeptide repeats